MAKPLARLAAARAVAGVLARGESLSALLPRELNRLDPEQRPLAQELAYGTLRWEPRLTRLLKRLMEKPLKPKESDLQALLLVALYQLDQLDTPPNIVVNESVEAVGTLGKPWAKGLTNAVLRNFDREREAIEQKLAGDDQARYAHPQWLIERLRKAWPGQWQAILDGGNARPPFTIRVAGERDAYLAELEEVELDATPGRHSPDALTLGRPVAVERLPRFAQGASSVQDEATQLAAWLLDAQRGDRVLDACAAPGGKTGHLLEHTPGLDLVALDSDPQRLERVAENLARIGHRAQLVAADAADPSSWWDGRPFQRILLDAPCSATGVIRRHPDIKQLRRPSDIPKLVETQAAILRALWPLLAPGGMLLYATCSVLPEENHLQVAAFLATQADARERPIEADWGRALTPGRQILPGEGGMDGFYYACLQKTGTAVTTEA